MLASESVRTMCQWILVCLHEDGRKWMDGSIVSCVHKKTISELFFQLAKQSAFVHLHTVILPLVFDS